jgi:hypothetical protein
VSLGRVTATAIEPIIAFRGFTACEIDAAAASMRACGQARFPERCSGHALFRPMTAPDTRTQDDLLAVMHRLHGERSAQEPRKQPPLPGTDRHVAGARNLPPPATLPDRADADEMLARLSQLPVEQREVLVLVVLEGLPYADIAALLDVPIGTVMSRLHCAREGMRDSDDR